MRYSEGDEAGEGCACDATETEEADCACGCEVRGADLRATEKEGCPGFVGPLIYGREMRTEDDGVRGCAVLTSPACTTDAASIALRLDMRASVTDRSATIIQTSCQTGNDLIYDRDLGNRVYLSLSVRPVYIPGVRCLLKASSSRYDLVNVIIAVAEEMR